MGYMVTILLPPQIELIITFFFKSPNMHKEITYTFGKAEEVFLIVTSFSREFFLLIQTNSFLAQR